jgi:methionyl-tRNA synthetase
VGYIKKAWRHPDAESLYIEEIDVGEEQPRQVATYSGSGRFLGSFLTSLE